MVRLSRKFLAILAFALLGLAHNASAETCPTLEGFAPLEDMAVYEGACLYGAEDAGFARFDLPIGPIKGRAPSEVKPVEGQLQRRLYVAPEGASAADVFLNYRTSLIGAGFSPLFECVGRACGSNNALLGKVVIYPANRRLRNLGTASEFALYIKDGEHYMAAVSADGTRHVALYVAQNQKAPLAGNASERAAVHLDLVTSSALETRMIDAAAMAKGISDEGHIALDNVYFDFGTATLSAEAAPAIAEMTKLLTSNPGLKVYIVGHTDWIGDAETNLSLSQKRAQAVMAALVSAGISKERLAAAGMGMLAPRASNQTEPGRAMNRRVELVERPG
ncbi:OmpA family protein [Rhizobium sp. AAP116]|uniref:OmpA family protein n=1 Tax=Rhizobium sp. AAP116 TaxID=1523429 RepID=UPI0006B98BDF|nr:OmpA family protein [Rhizobium sp. AAP116]